MKFLHYVLALTLLAAAPISVLAGPAKLRKGDSAGIFYVTKIAGPSDDGVTNGSELCYRCRYGASPMVLVFTRSQKPLVHKLAKEIDKAVKSNPNSKLKGMVTFIGEDVAEVKDMAAEFAKQVEAKHIPVVIAKETSSGPINYKLDDSDVTVVIVKDSQVIVSHKFDDEKLDVTLIMNDVKQMLSGGV